MKTHHRIGEPVTFHCHILGKVRGKILRFVPDVSNGQLHAELELLPPHAATPIVIEPVVNLEAA